MTDKTNDATTKPSTAGKPKVREFGQGNRHKPKHHKSRDQRSKKTDQTGRSGNRNQQRRRKQKTKREYPSGKKTRKVAKTTPVVQPESTAVDQATPVKVQATAHRSEKPTAVSVEKTSRKENLKKKARAQKSWSAMTIDELKTANNELEEEILDMIEKLRDINL